MTCELLQGHRDNFGYDSMNNMFFKLISHDLNPKYPPLPP